MGWAQLKAHKGALTAANAEALNRRSSLKGAAPHRRTSTKAQNNVGVTRNGKAAVKVAMAALARGRGQRQLKVFI